MTTSESVAPFPPPPKYYEDFEPPSNKSFKPPPPPKPIFGPYVVFGTLYDTEFAPQAPTAAIEAAGLAVTEGLSPVAALRQLNRALPEEYLNLVDLMIERPVLCTSDADREMINKIDQQREKVEAIIRAMYDCLARFRPYQARQALIATLRAQIERRKKQAEALRECRLKAEALITSTAAELNKAAESLKDGPAHVPHPLRAAAAAKEAEAAKVGGGDGTKKSGDEGGCKRAAEEVQSAESKRARLAKMMDALAKIKDTHEMR